MRALVKNGWIGGIIGFIYGITLFGGRSSNVVDFIALIYIGAMFGADMHGGSISDPLVILTFLIYAITTSIIGFGIGALITKIIGKIKSYNN